ncbi:hypothetical protein [Neobacillus mesonae]|uniref:Uncharacterized protein n=1 Tax=Neobacillus mesonae TaxID=1193713 RepID=A0A3Q9QUH2_9BACI|nr:hypothetical protein [Neobacillus mesonae]AZU61676.1 hypothetical protein CHR53_10525 [Neobacillus mesonae]
MAKFISIFGLTLMVSVIFFFVIVGVFDWGNPVETATYTIGIITVIFLSFLIALMFRLIELVKGNNRLFIFGILRFCN